MAIGKAKHYVAYRFQVRGSGAFPVDMLRYDRCAPETSHDVDGICAYHALEPYTVTLIGFVPSGVCPQPTADRWSSFGWRVLPGTVHRIVGA